MNEWKIGYLAGMIDGEGVIGIYRSPPSKNGFRRYTERVRICVNQMTPLKFLQQEVGGNLRWRRTTDDYELEWNGLIAKEIIKLTFDFLFIKKEQAQVLLDFPVHATPKRFSQEERDKREELYLRMKALNAPRKSVKVGEEKEEEDA